MQLYASQNGQETNTTWDHKKILKIFVRWIKLGSREFREVGNPSEIKNVKLKKVKDKIAREDLLTDDDVSKLLYACSGNLRDQAFLSCHYEAGTRPGEILSLKIKHVKFDNNSAVIRVDGKTGARQIRLITSIPYLAKWLDSHPTRDDQESPLWTILEKNNFGNPLTYAGARKLLERAQQKAGLEKRINLNRFRHSAATNCAKFMNEAQMRKRHGWTIYSKMPSRYVHLVDSDVDDALFSHLGLKKQKEKPKDIPQTCTICNFPNSAKDDQCSKCGRALNLKTALDIEEKEKKSHDVIEEQMKEMREELEDFKYGITARMNEYRKISPSIEDGANRRLIGMVLPLFIEFGLPEEKKRAMMKEFEQAALENRKPDLNSVLGVEPMSEEQVRLLREIVRDYRKKHGYSKPANDFKPRYRIENQESMLAEYP